ncbi:MAG TPA: hypothetical protein VF597_00260 [Candidatus Saccharimonadales bacterium]|jgi:hypothetical protein
MNTKTNENSKNGIWITVGIVVVILLVIVITTGHLINSFLGDVVSSSEQKMTTLSIAAADKAKTLSTIRFLNDQTTKGYPDISGDSLTAQEDPRLSTSAIAEFKVSKTLKETENEITNNLERSGYKQVASVGGIHTGTLSGFGTLNPEVSLFYSNGQNVLGVDVRFLRKQVCPTDMQCAEIIDEKPANYYDYHNLDNEAIHKVSVELKDKYYYEDNYMLEHSLEN